MTYDITPGAVAIPSARLKEWSRSRLVTAPIVWKGDYSRSATQYN